MYYNIRWYVIWGQGSLRELPSNDDIYSLVCPKYRYRDIRIIKTYWHLLREIKKSKPSVVYNGFLGLPYFIPLLFKIYGKKSVIYEGHEINPYISAKHDWLSVAYAKYNLKNVGFVQVFSHHAEDEFHNLYPGRECTYIPMVPKNYGEPSHNIEHPQRRVFLFFGGVRSTKRLDVLLNAFLALDENHSNRAELWVYGKCDGMNKEKYLKMIAGRDNIKTMFDFVPDELVPDLFCSATYLVQPYQQITQSGPMMIAYNYNLPIIATDIEGFRERILNGENGYLFEKNNVEDLKRVLIYCIDQSEDEYRRIKTNATAFATREYSIDAVITKYCEMLNGFIDNNER